MAATKGSSPKSSRVSSKARASASHGTPSRTSVSRTTRSKARGAASSSGPKTTANDASVQAFLGRAAESGRLADCQRLLELMTRASGAPAKMWGASIVGFGSYRYKYASGRQGDWPPIAFSPRKRDLAIYAAPSLDRYAAQLARLGTFTRGVSCLHVKQLNDIDLDILADILRDSFGRLTASAS